MTIYERPSSLGLPDYLDVHSDKKSDQDAGQFVNFGTEMFIFLCYHHHGVLLAQIFLNLYFNSSLSSITFSRSSMLHPVSVLSSCRWVLAVRPTLAHPCKGVYRSTSLMSLSLLFPPCPACLAWMVFEMGGSYPYSSCFVGYCLQDLFNTAHSILVQLLSSFLSIRLLSVHVVRPYSSIDITAAWKNCSLFYLIGLTSIWPIVYQ